MGEEKITQNRNRKIEIESERDSILNDIHIQKKEMHRAKEIIRKLHSDSLQFRIPTIDIDLQELRVKTDSIRNIFTEKYTQHTPRDSQHVFSITIPDFSTPNSPRVLRYNYNTADIQKALVKSRNRNILVTLLLFGLSIALILMISNRSLNPIRRLKRSFDDVAAGNLDIAIDTRRRDEIGDLSRSFDVMVAELRKNRKKEEMLQRKERLASMGQLAAGVAHEIKNPLNAIHLTIDHLKDRYTSAADRRAMEYIQTIQSEIRRLDKIVNNFLSFLRSEDLQKSPTDMNRLLDEILQLYQRECAAQSIEIQKHFAEPLIWEVDAERFKTVLANLLLNAIQAMPEGGKLRVETAPRLNQLRITDSGAGIPQKELGHIFDLFYTTKPSGSGLGLPTAYKIVKAHGGEIVVESEAGKGTTVVIELR